MTAFGLETGPQPSIFLIAEATLALLKQSGHPRIVIADDVQWLDAQTDEILTYVGRRAKATRVTVIGAARLGHRCLFLDAGFDRLELAGLPDEAGEQILDLVASALSSRDRAGAWPRPAGTRWPCSSCPRSGPRARPRTTRLCPRDSNAPSPAGSPSFPRPLATCS